MAIINHFYHDSLHCHVFTKEFNQSFFYRRYYVKMTLTFYIDEITKLENLFLSFLNICVCARMVEVKLHNVMCSSFS